LWAVVGPAPQPEEAGPTTGGPLRSALSDASANSSFTAAATGRLREGSAELAAGAEEMRTGGQQLATGMDQLQAGMGEAGSGAQEVAGGVREVVGAVRGVAVIQGQVSTAIDDALGRLEGDEPGTVRAREALTGLRDQLAVQGMDQATLSDLDRLEGGADELARQLSAPAPNCATVSTRRPAAPTNCATGRPRSRTAPPNCVTGRSGWTTPRPAPRMRSAGPAARSPSSRAMPAPPPRMPPRTPNAAPPPGSSGWLPPPCSAPCSCSWSAGPDRRSPSRRSRWRCSPPACRPGRWPRRRRRPCCGPPRWWGWSASSSSPPRPCGAPLSPWPAPGPGG